jgi:hypothetical protein
VNKSDIKTAFIPRCRCSIELEVVTRPRFFSHRISEIIIVAAPRLTEFIFHEHHKNIFILF